VFLQKTNIIRDFYEDLHEKRVYWPKEIYISYVKTPIELLQYNNSVSQINSLCCLNLMIENALEHFPDCLRFILRLNNKQITIFFLYSSNNGIGYIE
jgi:farnesyl-diphosphate farnesyltransferase